MKKKIYGMLVVLCCPVILNAQHVFAEELPTEGTDASAVVEEIMAEALMTVPEAAVEVFTEPVVEESTEVIEDSTSVDSSTDETEESSTEITEETNESATEESVEDSIELSEESVEVPVEDTIVQEEAEADTLSVEEVEPAAARAATVSTTIKLTVNGTVIHSEVFSGAEGDYYSYLLRDFSEYKVHSISDDRFGARQTGDFATLYIPLVSDAPEVIVELVSNTTVGVFFNLATTTGRMLTSEYGEHPVQVIYQENGERTYSYTPPAVEYYEYIGPEVITGEFDDSGMITVELAYYARSTYSMTVEYVDEFGKHIDTEVFHDAIWGYDYLFTPKTFPGRTLISVDGQSINELRLPYRIVMFPRENMTMTVVYSAIPETIPENPITPEDVLDSQGTDSVLEQVGSENLVPLKTIQPIENKKIILPETGEEMNSVAVMVGTALFLQAGYMMLKKKRDESEL
ncbi:MucBP domain-containing protein [Enterococcus sp. BWM-S5]|uniref:MucBP domain-containing protein n=1 Tax=Enterococcus larvae TaxID=2794352 RepID=A0ABS4CF04_9ENTE|nr:LPXTG cell wall anchor domain-containing protein [Enterococcus larvae]MBP1045005.1 MucBP domain-containing protein [Enterococcus larvae]